MSNIIESTTSEQQNSRFQVFITGIKWDKRVQRQYHSKYSYDELPSQFTLDLQENVLSRAPRGSKELDSIVESYCYDFLTKKFGYEVNFCQVWLPLS